MNCLIALATPLLGACALPAQVRPGDAARADPVEAEAARLLAAISTSDAALAHLRSLSIEIGGRLPGSDEDRRARSWAMARLRAAGVDSVWTQALTVPRWMRGVELAEVIAPHPHRLAVLALGFSVPTPDSGVVGPVIRFGSARDVLAATGDQLRGRIVFIDHPMPRLKDGRGYALVAQDRGDAVAHAGRMGVAALIIRSPGTSRNRLAHAVNIGYRADAPRIPVASLSNPDAELLTELLAGSPVVSLRLTLGGRNAPATQTENVIAEIRGSERPAEVVLLAAHLDSWDMGTGALDDGAGVAMVIEAATRIAASGIRPRRTMRFVLFAGEEIGLLGARAYAAALATGRAHVMALEPDQGAGRAYRIRGRLDADGAGLLEQIGRVLGPLGVEMSGDPSIAGPDLIPLRERGVATLDVAQDMTEFWDHAHSANDTMDKVKPDELRASAAAYAVVAYLSAQWPGRLAPARP